MLELMRRGVVGVVPVGVGWPRPPLVVVVVVVQGLVPRRLLLWVGHGRATSSLSSGP